MILQEWNFYLKLTINGKRSMELILLILNYRVGRLGNLDIKKIR